MPRTNATTATDSALLTFRETAAMLRCGLSKLRFLIASGDLDMRDLGWRTKRITRRSVEKLINEGMPLRRYRKLKLKRAS